MAPDRGRRGARVPGLLAAAAVVADARRPRARQNATAQRVAEALEASGLLQRVLYPGLASHPDHAVAKRQMTSFGSIFAVECRSETIARALPEELTLFRSATSLGGVESLAEWRRKYDDAVSPLLVRLSIGLEDPDDLIDDLLSALRRLNDDVAFD